MKIVMSCLLVFIWVGCSKDSNPSSSEEKPNSAFRVLNVAPDYLHDSVWIDTIEHYGYLEYSVRIDTTILQSAHGDTLDLYTISYSGSGFSGNIKFLNEFRYSCYLTQGKCNWSREFGDSLLEGVILHLPIGNEDVSSKVWNLAESDSAIIWEKDMGSIRDLRSVVSQDSFSYSGAITWPGPHHSSYQEGYRASLKAIPQLNNTDRHGLPLNQRQLIFSADYTKDSLWARICTKSIDYARYIYRDTIKLVQRSSESIVLQVRHYFGASLDSSKGVSMEFTGMDTIHHVCTKGILGRYMADSTVMAEFPLLVAIRVPEGSPSLWSYLASLDSVFFWTESMGIDRLASEIRRDNGLGEEAMEKASITLDQGGFQVEIQGVPHPYSETIPQETCSLSAIRE